MTETLDTTYVPPAPEDDRPRRVYRALAWVGIAAGSLFIVATVFFSGYFIGAHNGGGGGHHGRHSMLIPHPPMGPDGPMMGPDGPMGPERLAPPSLPSPPQSASPKP